MNTPLKNVVQYTYSGSPCIYITNAPLDNNDPQVKAGGISYAGKAFIYWPPTVIQPK